MSCREMLSKNNLSVLTEDEKMFYLKILCDLLDEYARKQKGRGFCTQCQHTMYDGMCSCGKWEDISVTLAEVVEQERFDLGYYNTGMKQKFKEWKKPTKKIRLSNIFKKLTINLSKTELDASIEYLNDFLEQCFEEMREKGYCIQCCEPHRKGGCECGKIYQDEDIVNLVYHLILQQIQLQDQLQDQLQTEKHVQGIN